MSKKTISLLRDKLYTLLGEIQDKIDELDYKIYNIEQLENKRTPQMCITRCIPVEEGAFIEIIHENGMLQACGKGMKMETRPQIANE